MNLKSGRHTFLLGAALLVTSSIAHAALTYTPGDLFIGFRATGGTGASQDYLVNVGQASLYTTGATGSFTVGDFGADLVAIFGSGWNANRGEGNNVQWAVIGTTYNVDPDSRIVYVSEPVSSATEFTGKAPAASLITVNAFRSVSSAYTTGGYTATANNPKGIIQGTGDGNSWDSFFQSVSNLDFNRFDEIEGNFVSGTGSLDASLNLFKINPVNGSASALQGTFSINNAGVVTYTATPVPEPSTVAFVGVAAAVIAIIVRRRGKALRA
jgi:hypothetical protein